MKKNLQNLVSIIIPVYNVQQYLPQCLESVCNQTYSNIEIIVVDDGSKDTSGVISDEYAAKDERIIVIHKANGGLSSARNEGICRAKGEYYLFVDSDDYIDREMVEDLLGAMLEHDAQLVECGMRKVYSDGKTEEVCNDSEVVLTGKEAVSSFLDRKNSMKPVACDSLYHKSIFQEIRFDEGRLHEDGWFKYKAFYTAEKVVVVPKAYYNYRQERDGSIMTVKVGKKNIRDIIDAFEARNAYFEARNESDLSIQAREAYYRELLSYYYVVNTALDNKKAVAEFSLEITRKLKQGKQFIKNSKALKPWKRKYWLFYYLRPVSLVIYKMFR